MSKNEENGNGEMWKVCGGAVGLKYNRYFSRQVGLILTLLLLIRLELNSVLAGPVTETREKLGSQSANQEQDNSPEYRIKFSVNDQDLVVPQHDGVELPETLPRTRRDAEDKRECGFPDGPEAGSANPLDPQNFEIGPSKWGKTRLTYRLIPDKITSKLLPETVRRELRGAMELWEGVSNIRFVEADTIDTRSPADIDISFERRSHGDNYPLDGPGRVLAHAFYPGNGIGGDVHFDDEETWTSNTPDGTNLLIVAAHELGHSLGLSHSTLEKSLMYRSYKGFVRNFQLHPDDIMGIQHLYGYTADRPQAPRTPMETMGSTGGTMERMGPQGLDTCGKVDAVSVIRGDIFVFSEHYFWWLTAAGLPRAMPTPIRDYWKGLPSSVERIDAAFERPENYVIVFFSGDRYYELDGRNVRPEFSANGKPLTDIGIPSSIKKIDAAVVWGTSRRVYLFSDKYYWKVAMSSKLMVEMNYQVNAEEVWKGKRMKFPIDTAFTNTSGQTYIIKGTEYWLLKKDLPESEPDYPKSLTGLWPHCSNKQLGGQAYSAASHWSTMTSLFTSALYLVAIPMIGFII